MKCLWLTPLFLLTTAGALTAQAPPITHETTVDYDILHQWLHSGDPRLIAWAADFARRTHDTRIVAEMPDVLEHCTVGPAYGGDDSQASRRQAITAVNAVLDALIQENAEVPIPAINAVEEVFPAQAAILISRLPLFESRQTLGDWSLATTGGYGPSRALARIASMMLAKDPKPSQGMRNRMGFVASVVAASEEEVRITVASANRTSEGVGSGLCADFASREATPGWPQVYTYDLEENDPQANAPTVVDLDGDRIVSRRFEENRPWGSCYGVQYLDPSTRHRLIAHWLGVPEKEMSWQPADGFTIVWTDQAAYQRQLGEIVEAQRQKLHGTLEALRQRALLTEGEAATVAPRLIVTVEWRDRAVSADVMI